MGEFIPVKPVAPPLTVAEAVNILQHDVDLLQNSYRQVRTIASPEYRLLPDDYILICNTITDMTIIVPINTMGKMYLFKMKHKSSDKRITIIPEGGRTIDDEPQLIVDKKLDYMNIVTDGLNWYTIG